MEHNAKNICKTVISSKEQNLNKQMVEFGISIFFQYFLYILAKFNNINDAWEHCFLLKMNDWMFLLTQNFLQAV